MARTAIDATQPDHLCQLLRWPCLDQGDPFLEEFIVALDLLHCKVTQGVHLAVEFCTLPQHGVELHPLRESRGLIGIPRAGLRGQDRGGDSLREFVAGRGQRSGPPAITRFRGAWRAGRCGWSLERNDHGLAGDRFDKFLGDLIVGFALLHRDVAQDVALAL